MKCEGSDGVAISGLARVDKTQAVEKVPWPRVPRSPHHVEGAESALLGLSDDGLSGEAPHAGALFASGDGDSPNATAKFRFRVFGVEVGADKTHNLVIFPDHTRPRFGRVDSGFFFGVRDRSGEVFLFGSNF